MSTKALQRMPRPDFGQALVPFDLRDEPSLRGTRILRHFFARLTNVYTRKSYADDFRVFAGFMRGVYRAQLSPAQVVECFLFGGDRDDLTHHGHANVAAEAFRQWQLRIDKSSSTINRRLAMLRNLTSAGRRLGLFAWSLEITSLRSETRSDTRGPVTADVGRLLDHLAALGTPLAIRDTAIIRLLHDLGLRRGEVAKLDVSDLDSDAHRLAGAWQRASRGGTVDAARRDTLAAVLAWLDQRGRTPGPLFVLAVRGLNGSGRFTRDRLTGFAIYRQVRTYGRTLGLKLRPHGFRHTAIKSAMIAAGQQGVPFEEVMQFSRHRQIITLMRYRDFLENRQPALAQAVASTLPKARA